MTAAWRALLRLARRDARRHPARAALVVLLVALPVAGLVTAVTLTGTVRPSPAELARASLGAADLAAYRLPGAANPAAGAPGGLPAGSRTEPIWRGELTLGGPEPAGDPATVAAIGVDLAGLGAGMFDLAEGRAPDPGTDQLALTEPLAQRLGARVGSPVTTDHGPATVSGILTDPLALDRQAVVVAPGPPPAPSGYLVDLPAGVDPTAVGADLQRAGWDATSPAELARSDPEQLLLILVLGGFGFLVTSLVSAAAFAVSAQRRRHDLALLAATGAGTGQLRRSVLASALLLGTAGSTAGVGLGLLVPVATLPWLPDWTNRAVDQLAIPLPLVVAVAAVGVLTALAASWLTARSAGRTPVAAALTDRRPPRSSSARLLVVGTASAGLGVAVTVATAAAAAAAAGSGTGTGGEVGTAGGLLLGSVLTMLGLGAVSPWLAERLTGRLGRRLPVGVRLAMRDTARFRSRTGPIVMAIVAGLGLSVAAGAALGTVQTGLARDHRPQLAPDQLLVDGPAPAPLVSQLRTDLPVRADGPITIVAPVDPTGARQLPEFLTVGDRGLLAALDAPAPAHTALRAGEVLVLAEPDRPDEAAALVEQAELIAPGAVRVVELDPVPQAVPPIVLSADTLERSGARPAREGTRWLVRLAGPVQAGQLRLAQEQADRFGQRVSVETGPPSIAGNAIQTAALAAAGVLSLLIVAVGLALLGQETRRDDAILTSVGAAPGTRRSLAAARATVLTLLGAGLAVPAGLLPVWGLTLAARTGPTDTLAVPGTTIAAVVLLVPAVAAGAAWLLTRPGRTTLPGHAP